MNSRICKLAVKLGLLYCLTVAVALFVLTLVAIIPTGMINYNVLKSSDTLFEEGVQRDILNLGHKHFSLDGFTDALMINEAYSVNGHSPLKSMLLNIHIHPDTLRSDQTNPTTELRYVLEHYSDHHKSFSYSRYWHGYLIVLRPLLTIFDYASIRIFNMMLFTILSVLTIILTYKVRGSNEALAFGITLGCSMWFIIPLSMQFVSVFYIAYAGIILILLKPQFCSDLDSAIKLFFILGMCTSFFDLLTAPIVSLGLPLIYLISQRTNKIRNAFVLCSSWSVGYLLFWATKWVLGTLITGYNVFEAAFSQVGVRLGKEVSNWELLMWLYENLIPSGVLIVILIAFIAFLFTFHKNKISQNYYLLIIALLPLVWLLLLNNHSYIHYWFSWRNLMVSIYAIILFFLNTTKIGDKLSIGRPHD